MAASAEKINIRIRGIANNPLFDWLPDEYCCPDHRLKLHFTPSKGERQRFFSKPKIRPSEFLHKIPIVSGKGSTSGEYDPDRYPYNAGIIDTYDLPCIRIAYIRKVPQSAQSTNLEAYILYRAEYDPVDVGLYYPDEKSVIERSVDHFKPKLKSHALRHLLTGKDDDLGNYRIRLASGMKIYFKWTSSLARLSSTSIGLSGVDEADKNEEIVSKKEAGVMDLIDGRMEDYEDRAKKIMPTTPSTPSGPVTQGMESAGAVFDFLPICPLCGELEFMVESQIRFDKQQRNPEVMRFSPAQAWYECSHCGGRWDDRIRHNALIMGEWYAREPGWLDKIKRELPWYHDARPRAQYLDEERPATVGFQIPVWVVPPRPLCKYAAAKIKSKGNKKALQDLVNNYMALPFSDFSVMRKYEEIKRRSWGQPFGITPPVEEIAAIICGLDTQDNSFYYWVHAFGWAYDADGVPIQPQSWQIDAGQIPSVTPDRKPVQYHGLLSRLEETLYTDINGRKENIYGHALKANMIVIDTGGHRTKEVYQYCLLNPAKRLAYKGAPGRQKAPWSTTKISKFPDGSAMPGGLLLYNFDKHVLHDWVDAGLTWALHNDGAIHVSESCTDDMAQHLTHMLLDEGTRRWKALLGAGIRHDYRDCLAMAYAGYTVLPDNLKVCPVKRV